MSGLSRRGLNRRRQQLRLGASESEQIVQECSSLLTEHGMTVSIPSQIPSYLRNLVGRSGRRHQAIDMAWHLADSAADLDGPERMERMEIAEQICMMTLLAWDEEEPPVELEALLAQAREML